MRSATELEYVMGPYFAETSQYFPEKKERHAVWVLQCFNYVKDVESTSYNRAVSLWSPQLHLCNQVFFFSHFHIDHQRYEAV